MRSKAYASVRRRDLVDVRDSATEMLNEFSRRHSRFDTGAPDFYFDDTFGETFVSDDDLKRSANEVGVIEFDSRPIITIIPEDFESRCL